MRKNIMICCLIFLSFYCWINGQISNGSTTAIWRRPITTTKEFICPFEPKCSCNPKELVCENFDDFKELNYSQKQQNSPLVFNLIRIKPRVIQNLTENSLDLTGLGIEPSGIIELHNIGSFYFNANPLKTLYASRPDTILKIVKSQFKLMFDKNMPLKDHCDRLNVKENKELRNHSLMSSANIVEFISVKFLEPICPYVFNNLKMTILRVFNPLDEFKFMPIKFYQPGKKISYYREDYNVSALGSFISSFYIENATLQSIDNYLINKDVFAATKTIRFKNVNAQFIEPNVFANLKYLKLLEMNLVNWKDVVDRDELQWMYRLNRHTKTVDFKNLTAYLSQRLVLIMNLHNYSMPNTDFCKFINFPLDKYVVPHIPPTQYLHCNCTIIWLLQHYKAYPVDYDFTVSSANFTLCFSDNHMVEKCNLLTKMSNCEIFPNVDGFTSETFFSIRNSTLIVLLCTFLIIGGILLTVFIRNVQTKLRIFALKTEIDGAPQTENAEMTEFLR